LDFKYTIVTEEYPITAIKSGDVPTHISVGFKFAWENVEQHVLFSALFVDALKEEARGIPDASEDDVEDDYGPQGTSVILKNSLFCALRSKLQGIFLRSVRTFYDGEGPIDKSDLFDLDD
jgi:hypothetical protein